MIDALSIGLLVWLKILLPGLAWLWILPDRLIGDTHRIKSWIYCATGAIALGVLLTSLSTFALGEMGWYTVRGEWTTRAALCVLGLVAGISVSPRRMIRLIAQCLPPGLCLLVAIIAIMLYPHRGEWIVGGWDPGIYMNEGAALARTGTFYPSDGFFYEELTEAEQESFTRTGHGRTERFPGILVHPETHSFSFELFRLTPAFYAALYRSGELHAMTRANTVLALLVLMAFMALLMKHCGLPHALFATLLLAAQPVFLHHANVPITEMLNLFLLCALLFVIVDQPPSWRTTWPAALFLFAAILNRFSFLPFAGILLICMALADASIKERSAVLFRRLALLTACGLGAIIDYLIAPASLLGWTILHVMIRYTAIFFALAVAIDFIASTPFVHKRLRLASPRVMDLAAMLLLAGMAALWGRRLQLGGADADNIIRLSAFTGQLPLILAGIGFLALLFLRPRMKASFFYPVCLFLVLIGWLLIYRKTIVNWYPWATRRYLDNLIPFIALSAGYVLARLWHSNNLGKYGKAAALILTVALLAEPASTSRRAWKYTQYNGISEVFEQISAQGSPADILIADHPNWGTPLSLIYGMNVLNGRELWLDESGTRMQTIEPALRRLSQEGWRVRFLTSTEDGLDIYPFDSQEAVLDWTSPEVTYQEIIQHPRADRFELRTRQTVFRLFTFATTDPTGAR